MISLRKFRPDDIDALSPIMRKAFDEDAKIHLHIEKGGPEGYDDGSFLKKWFLNPRASAFCVFDNETLIGGINLWIKDSNYNFLGCLFIDPSYENKGYGTAVWKKIEEMYPNTICWRTETPIFSKRNHHFYMDKCGFKCVRVDKPNDYRNGSYILEKYVKQNYRNKLI